MSPVDEAPTPAEVLEAAGRTIGQHAVRDGAPGRCPHCERDGSCRQLAWAVEVRREHTARQRRRTAG